MIIEGVILIIIGVFIYYKWINKNNKFDKISIKESIDLAQMPVVTFQDGDIKLNLLLDSGSTYSHISSECAKELVGTPIDIEGVSYITGTGKDMTSKMIDSVLRYKDSEFKVEFLINNNLDSSFSDVKKECGIQLHGILGVDFLEKYGYVIDMSELVVYPRKK